MSGPGVAPDGGGGALSSGPHVRSVEERRSWRSWYVRLVVGLYVVGAPTVAIGVSAYNTRQSERVWCDVVATLDDAYRNPDPGAPPLTARGRRIADGIGRVRAAYHC